MRRPMVAGNWKMHGTRASVAELIKGLGNLALPSGVDVAVFPSFLHINQVIDGLEGKSIKVGAQNAAVESKQGALTGEVAPSQLADEGCSLVLVGHSERRQIIGENDETLICKFAAAQECGLIPVLCIGKPSSSAKPVKRLKLSGISLAASSRSWVSVFCKGSNRLRAGLGHWHRADCFAATGAGCARSHSRSVGGREF